MKKEKIIIVITSIVIIGLIIGFVGYKIHLLNYYHKDINFNYEEISNDYKILKTYKINPVTLDDSEYLTVENMHIKNEFQDYTREVLSGVNDIAIRYNKDNSYFSIGITTPYLDYFKLDGILLDDKETSYKNRINYLDKKEITNDIELINLLNSNAYKTNIFTSKNDLKGIYSLYNVASILNIKNITLIEGEYEGFISNPSALVREVSLYKNNKRYVLIFIGEEFTEEKVLELINTISIG